MLDKLFTQIQKGGYKIFGPKEQDEEIHILELENSPTQELLKSTPDRPFKYFLMPPRETLYKYEDGAPKEVLPKIEKRALFGMNIFDCKALELYDKVFDYPPLRRRGVRGDLYYQENRKNLLIIGYSDKPVSKFKTDFFDTNKILENIVFDVFVEAPLRPHALRHPARSDDTLPSRHPARSDEERGAEMRDLKFYAQTKLGEKILKSAKIDFKKIEYSPRKEDKKVLAIKKAMEASKDNKLWKELGEICLACGKCTIACPTCFCFDIESKIGPNKQAERCSGNCFFDDFTRIAGGHKFLNNPAEKIYFWYYHKFVRIPHEYGLPGCTDCGRCTKVCPVEIDIEKNVKRLLKEEKN